VPKGIADKNGHSYRYMQDWEEGAEMLYPYNNLWIRLDHAGAYRLYM